MNISGTNVIQQVINQDVVTGSDGIVQIDNLKPGTYTVTEYPSDAYVPQAPKTVTVKPGEVAEVEFYNKLERGNLRLIKTSEDGNVAGIKMNISGNGVNKDVVTGSNGTVLEEGLLPGTYTVTEYPSELYVPQDPQTVTVVKNQTAEVKFNNVLKRFTITGTKVSGDGEKLGGAIFGIYDASKVTSWDQATMDNAITTAESSDDGSFTLQSDNMICGDTTYVVYELKAPEGYDLSREVIWTGTNGNGATISLGNVINTTHPELPATGGSGESPIQSALAIGLIGCSLLGLGVIFYRVKKHKGEGDVKF